MGKGLVVAKLGNTALHKSNDCLLESILGLGPWSWSGRIIESVLEILDVKAGRDTKLVCITRSGQSNSL